MMDINTSIISWAILLDKAQYDPGSSDLFPVHAEEGMRETMASS